MSSLCLRQECVKRWELHIKIFVWLDILYYFGIDRIFVAVNETLPVLVDGSMSVPKTVVYRLCPTGMKTVELLQEFELAQSLDQLGSNVMNNLVAQIIAMGLSLKIAMY